MIKLYLLELSASISVKEHLINYSIKNDEGFTFNTATTKNNTYGKTNDPFTYDNNNFGRTNNTNTTNNNNNNDITYITAHLEVPGEMFQIAIEQSLNDKKNSLLHSHYT